MSLTRRALLGQAGSLALAGAAAARPALEMDLPGDYGRRLRDARRTAFHLHNEPPDSTLHRALTSFWSAVYERTGGALLVTVLPLNANLPLDDAEAVFDVAAGRFGFVSVAAPIIDTLVPDIGLQTLPFAYRSVAEVMALVDQPAFAQLMDRDLAPANLAFLPGGTFSNGFRVVVSTRPRPVRTLDDLRGLRIRVPPSADIALLFRTLGADPVVTTIADMRAAIVAGTVEAEENPPAIVRNFDLAPVTHWVNVTDHIWTGFNTLANLDLWRSLPEPVRGAVLTLLPGARDAQVAAEAAANADELRGLAASGMEVLATDTRDARGRVGAVYAGMLERFSPEARRLAEPLLAPAAPH